jgi:adiponectin receptor
MDEALNSKLRPRRQQPVVKKNPEPCITADSSNPIPADQTGLENAAKIRLLSWDEIEHWQQNNRYIIRHYRPATNSYHQSIASLSYLHNQTVNIYSHLLGALAFIICTYILYDVFSSRYHSATMTDAFVFSVFFLGLFACLILSASFHTFNNHSHSISQSFLTLDMAGIVSLIMGSFYPGVYYGFYCEPEFTYIYWTMV